ncbi:MAG: radical SAM protein [Candidatus Omnitrophica bacterium]|nr:radical SAM protein [Candidatus Omnitrophota bacterium]
MQKISEHFLGKSYAICARLLPLSKTIHRFNSKPTELHLEFTNTCNCSCIFCGYQYQKRKKIIMSEEILIKAISDFSNIGGGDVIVTPIVGEALVDPDFIKKIKMIRAYASIKKILLTTNATLIHHYGIDDILTTGLTDIYISTAGFDKETYTKLYRAPYYDLMRDNTIALLSRNEELGKPVNITILIRAGRSLSEVLGTVDAQRVLRFKPKIDFAYYFHDFGGRIKKEDLWPGAKIRDPGKKKEPCFSLYNGPVVLPDGEVWMCDCAAAMDSGTNLFIGDIKKETLMNIWQGKLRRNLIAQFYKQGKLNPTCFKCTAYQNLDRYRHFNPYLKSGWNFFK